MISVQIRSHRIRTIQFLGYISIDWMSPSQQDGGKRLLTTMVEGQPNDR